MTQWLRVNFTQLYAYKIQYLLPGINVECKILQQYWLSVDCILVAILYAWYKHEVQVRSNTARQLTQEKKWSNSNFSFAGVFTVGMVLIHPPWGC